MFTPKVRLALAIAAFALGAYRLVANDYAGLILLAGAALLGYGYFKYGTVWLAFREVARGRMQPAARLLRQVKRPEALASQDRAYFELASGLVAASQAENQSAETHLKLALEQQLRSDNDRALAEAVLAQLLVARGQLDEARSVVAKASARECRPAIAQRLKALREELSDAPREELSD